MSRSSSPKAIPETQTLTDAVERLTEEVRVLRDAIDEIRQELQWTAQNRSPGQQSEQAVPVLKRTAADPCAADWNERLVIIRESSMEKSATRQSTLNEPTTPDSESQMVARLPTMSKLFTESGDQRMLF